MFNPEENRVDYGKILTPPDGFDLGFAIGTTYSLDLNALVGACMSLGLGAETESKLFDNKIFMLDVLRKACDKFVLFCEAGQIHYPSSDSLSVKSNSVVRHSRKQRIPSRAERKKNSLSVVSPEILVDRICKCKTGKTL